MKYLSRLFLDKLNLWPFLFPVFFLLHGYNESFGLISASAILSLVEKYFLVTASLVLCCLIVTQNVKKSFVFCFYLQCLYFFFGAIHDFIKRFADDSWWATYKVFLPELVIITVFVFIILRVRNNVDPLVRYSKMLLALFVLLELANLSFTAFIENRKTHRWTSDFATGQKPCNSSHPDIFFVVLDGYTSSACLRSEFQFDNSGIDSLLTANHFFTSFSSSSNYNVTPYSLSSTFEMQYLKLSLGEDRASSVNFLRAMKLFRNNYLTAFLKGKGYKIENYGCFELKDASLKTVPYFNNLDFRQLDNQTLFSKINSDIGFNWTIKNPLTGTFVVPKSFLESRRYHIFRNDFNFNNLIKALSEASSTRPRFVYTHLMLPHEPFFLKADGKLASDTDVLLNRFDLKKAYLDQLKYCNALLEKLIPLVSTASNRQRVVIIEGDHGFRDYHDRSKGREEFKNLNTYYFSDNDYHSLYQGISPVNSFRVVLNKYFCQSLPLLHDSSVFLIHDTNSVR